MVTHSICIMFNTPCKNISIYYILFIASDQIPYCSPNRPDLSNLAIHITRFAKAYLTAIDTPLTSVSKKGKRQNKQTFEKESILAAINCNA